MKVIAVVLDGNDAYQTSSNDYAVVDALEAARAEEQRKEEGYYEAALIVPSDLYVEYQTELDEMVARLRALLPTVR